MPSANMTGIGAEELNLSSIGRFSFLHVLGFFEALTGVLPWSDIVKKCFVASHIHEYVVSLRSSNSNLNFHPTSKQYGTQDCQLGTYDYHCQGIT